MTPEGIVKSKIRKVLVKYGDRVYYEMNVPFGFGTTSVDYVGCVAGWFFAIEAKRAKGKPTSRQEGVIERMNAAGAQTFVINDDASLYEFDAWLSRRVGVT